MCNLFGGGGMGDEESLQAQDSGLSRSLESHYNTAFADQVDSLNMLKSTIQRISSGQTGPGFSAEELAAKTGEIVNQAAAGARNVEQKLADQSAGQIFGGSQDASGLARASAVRQQLTGEALSAAETQKATALEDLTSKNYAQGRENAVRTAAGLEALSGAYGGEAGTALSGREAIGKSAFGEAQTIKQQKDAASNMLGGLLKAGLGIGGSFLTGGLSNLGAGESFGEGVGDFFKGGMSALSGQG